MRRMFRVTLYMFIVGFFTLLLIYFCESKCFCEIRNDLLMCDIFSIFRGNKDFVVNLLLGISTSAWFAAFGFFVEYFNKKRDIEKELKKIYLNVRNRCYNRIFFEKKSYKDDENEVSEICSYLDKYLPTILDYKPHLLIIKVMLKKFVRNFIKKKINTNHNYYSENKYALACKIFSELNAYFQSIHIYQETIKECTKIIQVCNRKVDEEKNTEFSWQKFEIYKKGIEEFKCYNINSLKEIYDDNGYKKEWFKMFCAADYMFSTYSVKWMEEFLILDEIIL